jgi:toxin ParE1/3/4
MRIFLSEDADADLLHIHRYIAQRNPAAAVSLARELAQKFLNISQFPSMGRERPSIALGVRSTVVGNYVIFYRIEVDRVTIMRIMDGRRDIDAEFQR